MLRDLIFAARTLRRSPVFTLTATFTIALGIGASTAIFSVTNAILLRPLPYKDADRLVVLYADLRARNNVGMPVSAENYIDLKNGSMTAFEDMAAMGIGGRAVLTREDGTPEEVRFGRITTNFFRVMGANIVLGRDFEEADGAPPPAMQVGSAPGQAPPFPTAVILSYEYWQRRFGGDPTVIGRDLPSAGAPLRTIVGVVARHFQIMFPPADNMETLPDVWTALRLTYDNADRNTYFLRPIGRLKRGVTLSRAQAEVESATDVIRRNFPLYASARLYGRVEPMRKALVAEVRPAILALMGAVILLLLIACANVANLLLVRASLRGSEIAVRSALGAGHWQIVRQMLAEAFVVTALGAGSGVALASVGIQQLLAVAPENLPRLGTVTIGSAALAFAVSVSLAAVVLFALVPAWNAFRLDLTYVLRRSSRTAGLRRSGLLRNSVVIGEVALCFVLLIGSGLMIRSVVALQRIDAGYDPHNLLTFQLLGGRPAQPPQQAERARDLESRLRAIAGVDGVANAFPFPLAGNSSTIRWGTEEALVDNSKYQAANWQMVRPGYFQVMKTRLLEGRTFTESDNDPERNLVVVDELLAAKAFPNQPSVGKRIPIRIRTAEPEFVEVIGVVGLYGVLSTAVRQRTAEIGLRMALGAQPSRILVMVVGHGLRLSAAGVAIGVVAAYAVTRLIATLLVGVGATDGPTFAVIVIVFFVIAAISSWLPARRAAALDPTTALRD